MTRMFQEKMNLSLVWQLSIVSSIIWQNLNYTLLCFDLIISYFLHSAEFYSCDHHKSKNMSALFFFHHVTLTTVT